METPEIESEILYTGDSYNTNEIKSSCTVQMCNRKHNTLVLELFSILAAPKYLGLNVVNILDT